MKGIIIYESPFMGFDYVHAVNLNDAVYKFELSPAEDAEATLSGSYNKSAQAKCSKKDTYDFEIGALISLMKMCGAKKSAEACCEAFPHETSGSIYRENKRYIKRIKELKEENERLEASVCAKGILNNKLLKDYHSAQSAYEIMVEKSADLIDKVKKLEEENEKLKLDCEKLQHGYIDTDMIFCGGRQNGKQYTFLVDLFKKIDQDKVDEAYKEAYNTTLPVWQKEVLKQMYDVYEESKEKTVQIKGFNINIKPSTKREQMWNDILACDCEHSKYVKVKKEDLEMFAKECNEKKIFSIAGYEFHLQEFWFDADSYIFQIFRKPAGFICATDVSFASENSIIDYLPPMRWDLFEKGRRIIRVTPDNLDEFMTKCSNELGGIMRPNLKCYKEFTHLFVMISDYHYDNKPTVHIMTPYDLVSNQHENSKKYSDKKIVNWEDVR